MRIKDERIALAMGVACAVTAAAVPPRVTPRFREVFDAFGADLPVLTRFFLQYSHALWLLPVVVVATWWLWPMKAHRARAACLMGAVGLAVVLPALMLSMYWPILRLGASGG